MKKLIGVLLFIGLSYFAEAQNETKDLKNLVIEGIPNISNELGEGMNQYQNTRSANFVSWSPDGKSILISTRFAEVAQLHLIDHPNGARKQLTFFKEPILSASFMPDEQQNVMFLKDKGGDEFAQLHILNLNTGKYEMISDGGRTQNSLPLWSNKGDQFIHVSTKRNGKDYDLYLTSINNLKEQKIILQEGGSWTPLDWSPDDKQLLVRKNISATKSLLYILNLATGKLEQINPSTEDISYGKSVWAIDGKGVFVINNQQKEFLSLKYYDITTKKFVDLTASMTWDTEDMTISKDRSTIVFSTNENGTSKLYQLNASTKAIAEIKGLPVGLINNLKFNPKRLEVAMTINSSQTPGDAYTYDLTTTNLTRWTYSEVGGLNSSNFVAPTLINYETFDKVNDKVRKIPAHYYKPKNIAAKLPVLIIIHGGPESQFNPAFNPFISFLTNELGIAVIAPNVRGSSGYGKTYLTLDNGFNRENSVKDIGALLDWIAKQPELDASKVGVYGGSYGGYMVLASMTHYNDRLKCGIDVVGISNFITFLQNTEVYRKDLRRVEYGDERDPKMKEFLTKISPLNNAEKITKPLFIIQGLNDPRVPASEAEQMKQKMRQKGAEVWYLLAKDEGHGFRKKPNVDYMQWAIVMFLQEKLIK